jgi:hypothetical protein
MSSEKERIRKAIFGKLRTLRRKLNSHGVPCDYSRSVLSHENGSGGFRITCHSDSNGDVTVFPKISIRTDQAIEEFDATTFEQGLARVRELFQGSVED